MKQLGFYMPMKKWRWVYQLNNKYFKGESMLVTDEWYGEEEARHEFNENRQGWKLIGRVVETEQLQ